MATVYPLTQVRAYAQQWEESLGMGTKWKGGGLLDYNFALEVQGLLTGFFSSLLGGEMEVAVIKHDIVYETGDSTTLFIPGATSFAPFSLSRGFGDHLALYNWFASASCGDISQARRNGTITLNSLEDGAYVPKVRWNFTNAWLSKISCFAYNVYQKAYTARLKVTIVAQSIELAEP